MAILALLGGVTALLAQNTRQSALLPLLDEIVARGETRLAFDRDVLSAITVTLPAGGPSPTWAQLEPRLAACGLKFRITSDGLILIALAERPTDVEPTFRIQVLGPDREPLANAYLRLGSRGFEADEAGGLEVPLAAWSHGGELSYVGMERLRITANSEPPVDLRLHMRPAPGRAEPILVYSGLSPKPTAPITMGTDLLAKALQTGAVLPGSALGGLGYIGLAGASGVDARSSVPALRGSQSTETFVYLDDLPVYHLDHLFGLFPAVDPMLVSSVELHRSHYPSRWGGSTGGVMGMTTKSAIRTGGELRLSSVEAATRLTLARGGLELTAGGRSSLGNVARSKLLTATELDFETRRGRSTAVTRPAFTFYDGFAKLRYRTLDQRWGARLQFFTSADAYDYTYALEANLNSNPRVPRSVRNDYSEVSGWRNGGLLVGLDRQFGAGRLELRAHESTYSQDLSTDGSTATTTRRGERISARNSSLLNNRLRDRQLGLEFTTSDPPLSSKDRLASWRYGLQLQRVSTVAEFDINDRSLLSLDQRADWLHVHSERTQRLGGRGSVNAGLRASRQLNADRLWLSPRVKAGYALGPTQVSAGYSLTQQSLRPLQHENQFGQTYTLLVIEALGVAQTGRAQNFTLGVTRRKGGVSLEVEAYYRKLDGVLAALSRQVALPSGLEIVNLQPSFLSAVGRGEVLGVDADLRYRGRGFSGQAAYTLSRSRRRFAVIAGDVWQRAPDDRRHRLATSHTYVHGPWSAGIAYELASGVAYVDLDVLASGAGPRDQLNPDAYLRSLPGYRRLDLRLTRTIALRHSVLKAGLQLFNAFARANVTQRQYVVAVGPGRSEDRAIPVGTDVALLGRLLVAEASWAF